MIVNGTHYNDGTPEEVVEVLERARRDGARIRVHYGDVETGKDWMDELGVEGTVGRSGGEVKVPLLIARADSTGGGSILTDRIVRIRYASKREGGDLYRHWGYHLDPAAAATPYTERQLERHWPGWRDDEVFVEARKEKR